MSNLRQNTRFPIGNIFPGPGDILPIPGLLQPSSELPNEFWMRPPLVSYPQLLGHSLKLMIDIKALYNFYFDEDS